MRRAGLVLACLILSACGGMAPAPSATTGVPPTSGTRPRPTRPGATHASSRGARSGAAPTNPGPIPPSSGFSPAAGEIVIAFTRAYINWTAATVSADMRALAARSVGQARSAMELAAGQTAHDYELHQGGIANSGEIEAVAPLNGSDDQWVIVTREQTTARSSTAYEGLTPAWHVTVATVIELPSGKWVVSGWQPES